MNRSLRKVAIALKVDRYWLKGFCEGRRLPLVKRWSAYTLSPESVKEVERHLAERTKSEASAA